MITLVLILLGVTVGWFLRATLEAALSSITDWRGPAQWAALGVLNIIAIVLWDHLL